MLLQRRALNVSSQKINLWESYDAHSKTTCSTDSLQAPQLGHFCDPPPAWLPNSSTAHRYLNKAKKKTMSKVFPLHILNTPQTQSLISIPYKLTIWIYDVSMFQTPHTLFSQELYWLIFVS